MTRKLGRPKKSQRNDSTAKLDSDVLRRAKFVADARKIPVAEYLTESLRPIVDRDFSKAIRKGVASENGE